MDQAPNRIRELRLEAGLSQQSLGDAVGVSKMTISDLERGNMVLTLDYMRRIARALGVNAADILPPEDNPEALSIEERQLIDQYRAADEGQREQLQKVADVLAPFRHTPYVAQVKPRRRRA
ncbi:helix-turn-helix transcriptional regulator [Novosphingobium sp.]|uniref:helix-turn-helix transcriptional regulator n=2 Tax=unclassified Novosphingobium TaxID=2644732 RepID=UPI002604D712|nr:helix-turn-helix transcriptional regulator [Novosphingobium sp.]